MHDIITKKYNYVSGFLPNSTYWLRQVKHFEKVTTGVTSCSTQFIKNVTRFGTVFGPSSYLYTRTHERNYTNYL